MSFIKYGTWRWCFYIFFWCDEVHSLLQYELVEAQIQIETSERLVISFPVMQF